MPSLLTRSKTANFVLGQPSPLSVTCLPMEVDVYNAIIFTRNEMQVEATKMVDAGKNSFTVSTKSVLTKVAQDVRDLWQFRGNLPTISDRSIFEKVEKVFSKGKDLQKVPSARRSKMLDDLEHIGIDSVKDKGVGKPKKSRDFLHNLFDICTCKCEDRKHCTCPKERKIPQREWYFLMDQRKTEMTSPT